MSEETNLSADSMLALASAYDSGVDIDSQPTAQPKSETVESTEREEVADVTPATKSEATEQKSDAGQTKTPKEETADKPKDKSSKFAQEQQRKAKTWEQINAEKEAIKAEREAIKREREEWAKSREQSKAQEVNSVRDDKGYTAEDYEAAAKEFDADGDTQLAKAARAKAEGVRKLAGERAQKAQTEQFQKAWADNFNRLSEKETWLKDQNSEEYKRAVGLLQQFPMLTQNPDGLVHAVEIVKLQTTAGKAQSLEEENRSLKDQLSKLQQKTAIGKGIPAGPLKAEEKEFSRMSLKEQRDALLRASRDFDRDR
jgi:hypothetical protein